MLKRDCKEAVVPEYDHRTGFALSFFPAAKLCFQSSATCGKIRRMKRLALLIYTCRTFIFRVPSRSQAPDWLMTTLYNQYADRIGRGARSAMTAKWRPEKVWRCQIMTAQDQSYVVWSRHGLHNRNKVATNRKGTIYLVQMWWACLKHDSDARNEV